MGGPAAVLVFVTLPHSTCCQALAAFVGSKYHIVTKVKAAFSILRKENGLFSATYAAASPQKKNLKQKTTTTTTTKTPKNPIKQKLQQP